MALVKQSNAIAEAGIQTSTVSGVSIAGVVAANTLIACCIAYREGTASGNLIDAYTTTIGGSPANTWVLLHRAPRVSTANRLTEITWWIAYNVAAGTTIGKPDCTYEDASTSIFHFMDEHSGIAASPALDKTSSGTAGSGAATVSTGSTGTLAQPTELVCIAYGNRYDYTNPATFPAGYTIGQRSLVGNAIMAARAAYREVSATTALNETWNQINQSDEGAVASIVTIKLSTTALRVEIDNIDVSDVTGTTGWKIGAWAGDMFTTQPNKVWTPYSAVISSGKLIFPDAPPGAVIGDLFNVWGYQPSGTKQLALSQGVVRAA